MKLMTDPITAFGIFAFWLLITITGGNEMSGTDKPLGCVSGEVTEGC